MARVRPRDAIVIRFDTDFDEEELTDRLDDMMRRSRDFRPVFEKIRDDLEELWSNNFLTNGLPSGGWAPLDPGYSSWKSANFPGMPPMIRTGRLFSSLGNLRGAPNEINRTQANFGTNVKYAKFHQYGTTKMPKREIVFVPDIMRKKFADYARDYVRDGVEGLAR
jgi:phage gpG-like protein